MGEGGFCSEVVARIKIAKQSDPGIAMIRGSGRDSTLTRATIICRTSN